MIQFKNEKLEDKFNELLILLKLNNINYGILKYDDTLDFFINGHIAFIIFLDINNYIKDVVIGNVIGFNKNDTVQNKMFKLIDYCINKFILKKEIL